MTNRRLHTWTPCSGCINVLRASTFIALMKSQSLAPACSSTASLPRVLRLRSAEGRLMLRGAYSRPVRGGQPLTLEKPVRCFRSGTWLPSSLTLPKTSLWMLTLNLGL